MARGTLTPEIIASARENNQELLEAFTGLLDGLYDSQEDRHENKNGDYELHEDTENAWRIWRKIAGDDRVPDDVIKLLDAPEEDEEEEAGD